MKGGKSVVKDIAKALVGQDYLKGIGAMCQFFKKEAVPKYPALRSAGAA